MADVHKTVRMRLDSLASLDVDHRVAWQPGSSPGSPRNMACRTVEPSGKGKICIYVHMYVVEDKEDPPCGAGSCSDANHLVSRVSRASRASRRQGSSAGRLHVVYTSRIGRLVGCRSCGSMLWYQCRYIESVPTGVQVGNRVPCTCSTTSAGKVHMSAGRHRCRC